MKKTQTHAKTLAMVQIALLSALVIVLQLFFSAVRVGPVTLSFVLVPIVIGAVFISPIAGAFIGFLAGMTTLIQVITSADPFYVLMMTTHPLVTAILCVLKTTAAGYLSGILYRLIRKKSGKRMLGTIASAALCPIVNTGIFCLCIYFFFTKPILADPTFGTLASANGIVYFILFVLVGLNFPIELALNLVLCPAIGNALAKTKMFKDK